jgi:V/A-type H+-transporting ATPase subunit D
MRAKQDLALATEGHRLLDQKREALILELLHLLTRLREQAKTARAALMEGYAAVDEAEIAMGAAGLEDASFGPAEAPEVSALDRSVMGVAIPSLSVQMEGSAAADHAGTTGPLAGTVPELEEGAAKLRAAVPELLRWAELHLAVYRLGAEVKKTQRRVNALGEVLIPETRRRIATITGALEEAEREEFFRRKRVKNRLRALRAAPRPARRTGPGRASGSGRP